MKPAQNLTFLFLCILQLGNLTAQEITVPNIKLDQADGVSYPPCEPSIVINPTNPDNILGSAIVDKAYVTKDGGKTWKTVKLSSTFGVFGDPCVIADSKGNFYYFHLADPDGKGRSGDSWLDRIVCQKSEDGGLTWNNGTFVGFHPPKDQDKEWAVVDPRNDHIYVTWTQFDKYGSKKLEDHSNILFSRSTNKSKKWKNEARINELSGDCIDGDGTTEGAVPAVGPNGEIYVAWSLNDKIFFDRSLDKGKTWLSKDKVIAEQKGGWDIDIPGISRSNGMPVTVTDLSNGPFRGNIYVNWADQSNGTDDTDIWIAQSADGGNTWSRPLRVNDDAPGKHQFLTWMSVDPTTGYIYIVFYDRRNYDDLKTDVFLAYSTDGGKSFKNVKISEEAFTPSSNSFFGDYNNISAYGGRICPIWTRMDDRITSVWTAVISEEDLGIK